jgi:catechol 2,3-dioxygenase-like lactoylglutathione lyase family enzyme
VSIPRRLRKPIVGSGGRIDRMAIIPQIRCSHFANAFQFYTKILDFEYVEGDDATSPKDAAFCVLAREGDEIFLCNFDGGTRSVIAIMTGDVDALFRKFRARGLQTPGDPNVPAQEVHQGPLDQTWGTREFYVRDPDGNSLRFTQVIEAMPSNPAD